MSITELLVAAEHTASFFPYKYKGEKAHRINMIRAYLGSLSVKERRKDVSSKKNKSAAFSGNC